MTCSVPVVTGDPLTDTRRAVAITALSFKLADARPVVQFRAIFEEWSLERISVELRRYRMAQSPTLNGGMARPCVRVLCDEWDGV